MGPHGAKDGFSTDAWGRRSQHNQFEGNGNHPSTKSSSGCANCCVTNIIVSFAPPSWCWITFTVISIALFTLYLALLSSLLPANANAVQPQIFEQPLKFERKRCQEKREPRHTTRHHGLKPACRSEAPEQACVGYYATNSKAFPVLSPTTLYTQLLLPPRPFNEHLLAGWLRITSKSAPREANSQDSCRGGWPAPAVLFLLKCSTGQDHPAAPI